MKKKTDIELISDLSNDELRELLEESVRIRRSKDVYSEPKSPLMEKFLGIEHFDVGIAFGFVQNLISFEVMSRFREKKIQ